MPTIQIIFKSKIKKAISPENGLVSRKIFEWALNISGFCEVEDLPRIKQPAQVLLLGLLIMTDWLSSNEEYFPLVSIDEEDVPNISTRSEIAFDKWRKWKEFDNWMPEFIPDIEEIYKDRFVLPKKFKVLYMS